MIHTPKGIKHQFGQRPESWIFNDLTGIQLNTLFGSIVSDVLGLLLISVAIWWKSTGLLLSFQEGVDVILEQSVGVIREMPNFIDLYQLVAYLQRLL